MIAEKCMVVHATGFSQWLMTNLQAPNLFGEKVPLNHPSQPIHHEQVS
ncbi:MAG: hypothetical protein NZ937_03875 [Armatimonadetes bacterium]|nr:hypothetical protein [Armatimonadota bacterium]